MLPFMLASSLGQAQIASAPENPYAQFTERWHHAAVGLGCPSYSLAIVKDGKVHHLESWGYSDLGKTELATIDTPYYIASVTKTYTALAISILESQGKLSVKDPVTKYLPWFKLAKNDFPTPITIEDLLAHRPGIDCQPAVILDAYTGEITEERYRFWLKETGKASGNTTYANEHFTLLGRVIEAVTKKPWQEALQSLIFDPLKLSNTSCYASKMYSNGNGAQPLTEFANKLFDARPLKTDATMHAAGGIGTSARDLATYMSALMSSNSVIPTTVRNAMFAPLSSFTPNGQIRQRNGFARGWNTGNYRQLTPLMSHGGGYAGSSSIVAMLPEKGLGFALLVNGDGPAGALEQVIMLDVFDQELGIANQPDLLPGLLSEVAKRREQMGNTQPDPFAFHKSVRNPLSLVGTFSNTHWGTLRFFMQDGMITATLGHFTLTLASKGDSFIVQDLSENTILTPIKKDGKVVRYDLAYEGKIYKFDSSK